MRTLVEVLITKYKGYEVRLNTIERRVVLDAKKAGLEVQSQALSQAAASLVRHCLRSYR